LLLSFDLPGIGKCLGEPKEGENTPALPNIFGILKPHKKNSKPPS
jgi:hypothetical protein